MPKSAKPNILRSELLLPDIELNPEIQAAVARMFALMLGWDDGNEIWRLLNVDSNGRLEVSTSSGAGDTGNNSAVSVAAVATEILADNPDRKYFVIQNSGTAQTYIAFGTAPTTTTGLILQPYAEISGDYYTGPIYGIVASGTSTVRVAEVS